MSTVPFSFSNQVGPIPLSELDVNFANVKAAAVTAGTVTTNAQPNITSVGTLTALSVAGNIVGNLTGRVTGNVTGNVLFGAGFVSGTGNIICGNISIGQNAVVQGNLTVLGTTTSVNSNSITTNNITITVGNNQSSGAALNGGGLLVGQSNIAKWQFDNLTTSWQSNIAIMPSSNVALDLGGVNNTWRTAYLGQLSVTGAVTSGTVTTGNVQAGIVSASGNIIGFGIATTGNVSATGNIIAGANVSIGGNVSAGGNITAPFFIGAPSGLSGFAANLIAGNATNASNLVTGNFSVSESSGNLIYRFSGTPIAAMSTTGNLTLETPLPVFSGGTGLNSLTANAVILGNATGAVKTVAPGNVGNVLVSNGSSWISGLAQPVVVFDGSIPYNSTTTFTINPNKLTVWFVNEGNGAGGRQGLFLGVSYGTTSLTNSVTFFNATVDFQVTFAGALMKTLAAGNGTTLLIQPFGNNIGGYGAPSQAQCLVLQF